MKNLHLPSKKPHCGVQLSLQQQNEKTQQTSWLTHGLAFSNWGLAATMADTNPFMT